MPLAIDLFCGLGGWTEGLLAEGYDVVGFDIERHQYMVPDFPEADGHKGTRPVAKRGWTQGCAISLGMEGANNRPRTKLAKYPAQLVIQDVLTLHGSQFRNAALIVASPPCQEYSYMAMPWKLAKAKAAAIRADETGVMRANLTRLFDACFRIQREACEASGRYIPMVVENVKGAQPWVGRAKANFGSFYLWGDVAMVGKRVVCGQQFGSYAKPMKAQKFNPDGTSHGQGSWFAIANSKNRGAALKVAGFNFHQHENGGKGGSFQSAAVAGMKGEGGAWFNDYKTRKEKGGNIARLSCNSSKSSARKAASAQIAKIPLELSSYIARVYRPENNLLTSVSV